MKNTLLFFVSFFCVTFVWAQTQEGLNNVPPYNENIFNDSDLIFEGHFKRVVDEYDTKGNGNYEDIYIISEYKVNTVYKGNIALQGRSIFIIKKGGYLGNLNIDWDNIQPGDLSYIPMAEKGIPYYNCFSDAIFFSKKSDYPDDENSKYFQESKYIIMDMVYVYGGCVAGFNDFPFSNLSEMHNWMKQFEGYAFSNWNSNWKPGENWINGAEQDPALLESDYYKEKIIWLDSLYHKNEQEIEENSKKKGQEGAKSPNAEKNLSLYIDKPVKVQEGSKYFLKFDIMVKTNSPETYLAETSFTIVYDKSIFGTLTSGKVNYSIDDGFKVLGNNYEAILFFCNGDLAFNFGYNQNAPNPSAPKVQLHTTPVPLFHIKLELLGNVTIPTTPVSFFSTELSNVSKYTLAQANTTYYYSKTYYKINTPPSITGITTAPIVAGVGEILTIQGTNFGTTKGKIYFKAADNGGSTYLNGLDAQYIETNNWSNTQIKVIVPSYVKDGYEIATGKNGGAGTGTVMVMTAAENFASSTQSVQIPYSITNRKESGPIKRVYLARVTCNADFLFVLDDNLEDYSNRQSMVTAIDAALNKWSSLTGLSLKLDKNADGVPRFKSDLSWTERDVRYLIGHGVQINGMAVSTKANEATINGNNFLYGSTSSALVVNTQPIGFTWNFSTSGSVGANQVSFYQAFLHELGHILLLGHINDASELMYYKIIFGQTTPIHNLLSSSSTVQAALQNKAASNAVVTLPNNHNIYPVGATGSLGVLKATFSVKHATNNSNNGHILTTPTGGTAPYNYQWTGPGTPPNTQNIYNLSSGKYSLLLSDNAGCSNNYTVTVSQSIIAERETRESTVEYSYLNIDSENNKSITLFPNPSAGTFSISNINQATVYLYNTLGTLVKTIEHIANNEIINISNLSSGIYFLKIIDGSAILNEKLILSK